MSQRAVNGFIVVDTLRFEDPDAGLQFALEPGERAIGYGVSGRKTADYSNTSAIQEQSVGLGGANAEDYPVTVYIVVRGNLPRT